MAVALARWAAEWQFRCWRRDRVPQSGRSAMCSSGSARVTYEVFSNTGTLKQTITVTVPTVDNNRAVAGCWFDSQFSLYTTNFSDTKVVKHNLAINPATGHTQSLFANTVLQAPDGHTESLVAAVNGSWDSGHAGPTTKKILKYSSTGQFLTDCSPAPENGGTDWMDCRPIKSRCSTHRGDRSSSVSMWARAVGKGTTLRSLIVGRTAYAIRLLPPYDGTGGMLVANNQTIVQLDG